MSEEKVLTGTPDFNWESYEKGENISGLSHEEVEQAYNGTLNKVWYSVVSCRIIDFVCPFENILFHCRMDNCIEARKQVLF